MRRREFITLIGAAVAWPRSARAQHSGRVGRVGVIPDMARAHRDVVVRPNPDAKDHTLYASHTVRQNRATFEAWTKSEAFRAAHARARGNKPLYLGHPQFEGFEAIQAVGSRKAAVT